MPELEHSGRDVLGESKLQPILRRPELLVEGADGGADANVALALHIRVIAEKQPHISREICLNELVDSKSLVNVRSIANSAKH